MNVQPVVIDGNEVLALHRMLMETKFDNIASVYAGSPYIAAVQNRLADALEAANPGTTWTDWRGADRHGPRVDAVRHYVGTLGEAWRVMNGHQREQFVRSLLAPLRASDVLVAEIVQQASLGTATDTAKTTDNRLSP